MAKMIDMDLPALKDHFATFMDQWFEARCFEPSSWKFVVKKTICDLENYTSDLPDLP